MISVSGPIKPGSKYRIDEKVDGKFRIVGPMKPYGWYGFFQDDKGFMYFWDKYIDLGDPFKQHPERDLKEEVK